ncbi:Peptidoglycan D,D-transpeptidase MrdA [Brevundimonas sp. NIBR10]|uniref:penicillin-binding protein 2 n=1 Tax=Brevundimonas sp. NIBR10 TaxID=3015997 RepID=UPI0022F1C990|nr:penicillin-binding protein 2 [Brevundimonas sp. NIBR10]WGM46998.1 Peptidoglycan D,D-transpeptidase MrdA [Brevundimonas sp. NIBR10]
MSNEPSIFFSDVNERQGSFLRRTFVVGGATALGVAALTARLAQLQVVQAQEYSTLASENQFNFRLVPPPRGRVLDRNGVVIAGNRPSFRVLVVRDETKDLDQTLDLLGRLLPDTIDRRRAIIRDVNAAPRFSPVPVKTDLSWEEFARVNLYAPELPGVMADMNETRFYPFGGSFAHVIGYVAKVTDRDIKAIRDKGQEPPTILFNPGFRIGRSGVEKALDADLRGEAGGKRVEVDARGRVVAEDIGGSRPAINGKDVVLTLDADVQNRALEVFGDESGACVVMDVRNGDILCMTSSPSFDPNLFVGGVPSRIYRAWSDFERKPLLDKTINGVFPPGSTFKPATALALLAAGVDPADRVNCSGVFRTGQRCWGRHGSQDMHEAIKNSCDIYFYTMCNRAGVDGIRDTALKLGFEHVFDIGVDNQKKGLLPSTDWKRRTFPRDPTWHPGETTSVAIGQGAVTVNALQLATYTARLANGKKAILPRLIKSVGGVERPSGAAVPDLPFNPAHIEIVRQGMIAVANDRSGTAYRQSQLGLGDIQMAGKTGTAQSRDYGSGTRKSNVWAEKDHNLFIAFAPVDAPRYAVAVIIEHGGRGGGTAGAPRAREVMRTVLLKDPEMRERITRPPPPEATGPQIDEGDIGAAPEPAVAPPTPARRASSAPARDPNVPPGFTPYQATPR